MSKYKCCECGVPLDVPREVKLKYGAEAWLICGPCSYEQFGPEIVTDAVTHGLDLSETKAIVERMEETIVEIEDRIFLMELGVDPEEGKWIK